MKRRSFVTGMLASTATVACTLGGGGPKSFFQQKRSDPFVDFDATEMASLVRRGEVLSTELVEAAISRIKRLEPKINALTTDNFEQALKAARRRNTADFKNRSDDVFSGVPYLLKDLISYPNLPFTAGSRMLAGRIGTATSDYVRAKENAGLIILGKTATPEFGLSATTESLLNGPSYNPWNRGYSTGGSSGGAAAAVAARMAPFAHASDGGGSVRIPASVCGVFGLKPSRGRQISAGRGKIPGNISVNHCVSLSVRDSARMLTITQRVGKNAILKPVDFVSGSAQKRLRIGYIPVNYFCEKPDKDVETAIYKTAQLCDRLGHDVYVTQWPFKGDEFLNHFMTIWCSMAAGMVKSYHDKTGKFPTEAVLEPWTLGLAHEFKNKSPDAIQQALDYFKILTHNFKVAFKQYDVLLSPVLNTPSVAIGYIAPTVQPYEFLREKMLEFASYTPAQNAAGLPAMSVPLGFSEGKGSAAKGLPIGSQFTADFGQEEMLLALAYELEEAQSWISYKPDLLL